MPKYDMKTRLFEEQVIEDKRLGRHVEHDARSLDYAVEFVAWPKVAVEHKRNIPILDQGNLGSCTGNAATGMLGCDPFWKPTMTSLDEAFAIQMYEQATALDNVPGKYPPDDTGSSGLAICKALRKNGWCKNYHHAFGLKSAVSTLTRQAVIIGIGWYDSFDQPDSTGRIKISPNAGIRGGHEVVLRFEDPVRKLVKGDNSWGEGWGLNGSFFLGWDDFDRLLHEGGDVTTISI